jgi:hypothetical protein
MNSSHLSLSREVGAPIKWGSILPKAAYNFCHTQRANAPYNDIISGLGSPFSQTDRDNYLQSAQAWESDLAGES